MGADVQPSAVSPNGRVESARCRRDGSPDPPARAKGNTHKAGHPQIAQIHADFGRWTTNTRAIVEKREKAEKASSFPGFSHLFQSSRR